ncbi:MAG: hypothetical protein CSA74_01785 [Rhodobacterales bacterium]|nr:MAG: hypothetical protein CSA74_01785 [Rhodobacterales bacterium]
MTEDHGARIVRSLIEHAPLDACLDVLRALTGVDRYQASAGVEHAVSLVAEAAQLLGLPKAHVTTVPAVGEPRWFSFRTPVAWTPTLGRLRVPDARLVVDHAVQPFALATYSAPRRGRYRVIRPSAADITGRHDLRGTVALVEPGLFAQGFTLEDLAGTGTEGLLLTDRRVVDATELRARVELPPGSGLFGFSLTGSEFDSCRSASVASPPVFADINVRVAPEGRMPLLELVLPGQDPQAAEVWVTSHLCHPRPGANDNASGVAAALLLAASIRAGGAAGLGPLRRTVRFIMGPEFLATAFVIHRALSSGTRPRCVLNLDMVGEDQQVCRSPLVLERSSTTTYGTVDASLELGTRLAFEATAPHPGTWSSEPFLGFSDHALFADPSVQVPAVALCHPADVFNHSDGDIFERVDPTELLRCGVAGAVAVALEAELPRTGPLRVQAGRQWAQERWLEAVRAASARTEAGSAWTAGLLATTADRLGRAPTAGDGRASSGSAGPRYERAWEGPMNVRELVMGLPPALRRRHDYLVREDKSVLSMLFNALIRIGDGDDLAAILDDVSWNALRPLPDHAREHIVEVLAASSWVRAC